MQSQGFRNIPTEWWHFNACSRNEAKKKYKRIDREEGF
jgi:D-alanyl-D-alanine dipeptidase